MSFELSSYQKDILDFFVKNPTKNMMVRALAGSGKSSTACILTDNTTAYSVYLAFNASVVEEFKTRITNPKVKVYTMHSLSYAIMNYNLTEKDKENDKKTTGFGIQRSASSGAKLDNLKMYNIFDKELITMFGKNMDFMEKCFYKENLVNLYNLCHLSLTNVEDYDAVDELINNHNLFENYGEESYEPISTRDCMTLLKNAENKSLILFRRECVIDFTDMLWITHVFLKNKEWEVPFWAQFVNVLVDESQDLSPLQQQFLFYIKRKNGRYIFILDENQAIYAFAASDAHSCKNLKKMFTPIVEFDLPICYRCAKSHLERVNRLYDIPIQPRANAPEGTITTIEKKRIAEIIPTLTGSTMVISRKNKWLSEVVMSLAKAGVPIYIEDKDMVAGIKKVVSSNKHKTLRGLQQSLIDGVESYKAKTRKLAQESVTGNIITEDNVEEMTVESAKVDNINFVLGMLKGYLKNHDNNLAISKDVFEKFIDRTLNTTPTKNAVRICSVHKAKGLEADNVFVLNEAKVCKDFRNSLDQNNQEKNLSYISITRAKENLFLVKEPSNNKNEKEKHHGSK